MEDSNDEAGVLSNGVFEGRRGDIGIILVADGPDEELAAGGNSFEVDGLTHNTAVGVDAIAVDEDVTQVVVISHNGNGDSDGVGLEEGVVVNIVLGHVEGQYAIVGEDYVAGVKNSRVDNAPAVEVVARVGGGADGDRLALIIGAGTRHSTLTVNSRESQCVLRNALEGGSVGGVAGDEDGADSIGVAIVPLNKQAVGCGYGGNGGRGVVGIGAGASGGTEVVVIGVDVDCVVVGNEVGSNGHLDTSHIGGNDRIERVDVDGVEQCADADVPVGKVITGVGNSLGIDGVAYMIDVYTGNR